jgi:hypothetical protein
MMTIILIKMIEICEHWLSHRDDFFKKLEFELCFKKFKLGLCYFVGFVEISIIWNSFVLLAK